MQFRIKNAWAFVPAFSIAVAVLIAVPLVGHLNIEASATQKAKSRIAYARMCAKAMGHIPAFDCTKGTAIPITAGGKELFAAPDDQKCDADTWGPHGNNCVPGSRFVNLSDPKRPAVLTLALCRKDEIAVGSKGNPFFNDIAIIQHDSSTGDACFFQSQMNTFDASERRLDGRNVPSPEATTRGSYAFWQEPIETIGFRGAGVRALPGNCTSCHDASPFLVSPWLKVAILQSLNGRDLRERIKAAKRAPYAPDRFIELSLANYDNRIFAPPRDDSNTCTNCHRFAASSWKRFDVANRSLHGFMPPNDKSSNDDWRKKYGPEIDRIAACLSTTPAADCAASPFIRP